MSDYRFNAETARDALVRGVAKLARDQHFSKVVIGISGGKDSTVCAAVCARALGKENVYGVMIPDGEQKDISDSIEVCRTLGINRKTVNIGKMHESLLDALRFDDPAEGEFPVSFDKESNVNVGPRLRMTTLRYIAQFLGARLVGTGNLSESTVGYCTKDGDTSCDFALLLGLTSVEVVEVGLTMPELPRHLVVKTPTDGLSGLSDEEKLGVTYQAIHAYIRKGTSGDAETDAKIRAKEAGSAHKRNKPPVIDVQEAFA